MTVRGADPSLQPLGFLHSPLPARMSGHSGPRTTGRRALVWGHCRGGEEAWAVARVLGLLGASGQGAAACVTPHGGDLQKPGLQEPPP